MNHNCKISFIWVLIFIQDKRMVKKLYYRESLNNFCTNLFNLNHIFIVKNAYNIAIKIEISHFFVILQASEQFLAKKGINRQQFFFIDNKSLIVSFCPGFYVNHRIYLCKSSKFEQKILVFWGSQFFDCPEYEFIKYFPENNASY